MPPRLNRQKDKKSWKEPSALGYGTDEDDEENNPLPNARESIVTDPIQAELDARSKRAAKERERLLINVQKHQAHHRKTVQEINSAFQQSANEAFDHFKQTETCINDEVMRYMTAFAESIVRIEESMQNILMHLEKRHGAQGSVQLWEAFNEFIKLVEGQSRIIQDVAAQNNSTKAIETLP